MTMQSSTRFVIQPDNADRGLWKVRDTTNDQWVSEGRQLYAEAAIDLSNAKASAEQVAPARVARKVAAKP